MFLVAESVTSGGLFETNTGDNFSGVTFFDTFAFVGVHQKQTTDPFFGIFGDIVDFGTSFEHTGVNTNIRKSTNVGIRLDFEKHG